jgi:hypothetical protein
MVTERLTDAFPYAAAEELERLVSELERVARGW